MAVKLTPEQAAAKWGARLKQSIDDMRSGAQRVEVAPGKKAAARADKWQLAMSSNETKNKWVARVGAVTVEDWRTAYINKGLNRVAAGVDSAQTKVTSTFDQLFKHENAGLAQLDTMADLTLEDGVTRATFWIRHMAKLHIT